MTINNPNRTTPYPDINEILYTIVQRINGILGDRLIGLYLTGSLSYGGFKRERSDIDLLAILKTPASNPEIELIGKLHADVGKQYAIWSQRIECSYIPLEMLPSISPPKTPRPYFGGGIFFPEAPYGNEWLINQYLLYEHGIALIGPDFKTLAEPVSIEDVQKACIRDLFEEWEPKIADPIYLADSHQQSYVVLNLCRILYTVMRSAAVTKQAAALWAKTEYPAWKDLIEAAESWQYGIEMDRKKETIEFIKFVINKVRAQKVV